MPPPHHSIVFHLTLRWRAKVRGLNDAEHKQLCGELPCRSRSAAGGIHSRGGHRTPEYSNMSGGTIYSGGLYISFVTERSNQQVCDVHVTFLQSGSANPQICAREEADSSQAIFRACMAGDSYFQIGCQIRFQISCGQFWV